MLPTLRDRPAAPRHEGLLAASAGHRRTGMSTWARAALDRREKLLTLCAPIDTDIANRAGSALTALTPEDLHTTAWPAELLQRARPDRDHGLGILVWADAVISATSRDTHVEIETTLAGLCRDHRVSVLCVYDRGGERRRERDGAGTAHLDLAVGRHLDGLQEQRLALHRTGDSLYVDGEIDMSNLDVFATAVRALTDTPSPTVRRHGWRDVPRRRRGPHPHPRYRPLPRPRSGRRDPRHPAHHPHPPVDRHPQAPPTSPQLPRGAPGPVNAGIDPGAGPV
jgi:hypothetical protein